MTLAMKLAELRGGGFHLVSGDGQPDAVLRQRRSHRHRHRRVGDFAGYVVIFQITFAPSAGGAYSATVAQGAGRRHLSQPH